MHRFKRQLAQNYASIEPSDPLLPYAVWRAFSDTLIPVAREAGFLTQKNIAQFGLLAVTLGQHFLQDGRFDNAKRALMSSGRLTDREFFASGRDLQDVFTQRLEKDGGNAGILRSIADLVHDARDLSPFDTLRYAAPAISAPMDGASVRSLLATFITMLPETRALSRPRQRISFALTTCYGISWPKDPRRKAIAEAVQSSNDEGLIQLLNGTGVT